MSTHKETIEFILEKLDNEKFTTRAMFGEYALYADGKVVALVCDDQLYVKIMPESHELESVCEKAEAYPGSKPYYLVEESDITKLTHLPRILLDISKALPAKKAKKSAAKKLTKQVTKKKPDVMKKPKTKGKGKSK